MLTGAGVEAQPPRDKTAWQAEHNIDIQRVTQTAIIHELTQQQVHTIETTVPWFLDEMPGSYFRQVPEAFRMDHLKAIAAIKDANMDCKFQISASTNFVLCLYSYHRLITQSQRSCEPVV